MGDETEQPEMDSAEVMLREARAALSKAINGFDGPVARVQAYVGLAAHLLNGFLADAIDE